MEVGQGTTCSSPCSLPVEARGRSPGGEGPSWGQKGETRWHQGRVRTWCCGCGAVLPSLMLKDRQKGDQLASTCRWGVTLSVCAKGAESNTHSCLSAEKGKFPETCLIFLFLTLFWHLHQAGYWWRRHCKKASQQSALPSLAASWPLLSLQHQKGKSRNVFFPELALLKEKWDTNVNKSQELSEQGPCLGQKLPASPSPHKRAPGLSPAQAAIARITKSNTVLQRVEGLRQIFLKPKHGALALCFV